MRGAEGLSGRITEAELREIGSGPQDDEVSRYEAQRLVDELQRVRGLIVTLDLAIEVASSGAVQAGERIVYLAEHAPAFFVEARRLREEGARPAPPARHVHEWTDVTRLEDPSHQTHELCSSSDGVPCPTPHRFIRYEATDPPSSGSPQNQEA